MTQKKPDFIIVGAAKSGTTSVHEYLNEHPGVFMSSPKETDFFAHLASDGRERFTWGGVKWDPAARIDTAGKYSALFATAKPGQVCGEASPSYLFNPRVPQLVHDWNPDVRIVLLLRDPAERAWSDFLHNLRDGTEPLPVERFLDAFHDGKRRVAEGWIEHADYEIKGNYGSQLENWLRIFPREQVGVFFYDDLRADPRALIGRILAFIGADASFVPDVTQRYNVTGVPKRRWLHRFIVHANPFKRALRWLVPRHLRRRLRLRVMQMNLDAPPPLPDDIRRQLAVHYLAETEKLEQLCGRDLSAWKPRG